MKPLQPLLDWWKDASPLARAMAVTGLLTVLIASAFFGTRAPDLDLVPLYGRMSAADAGEVVEALEQRKVPFQLADAGTTVMVPRAQVYQLRLEMASAGLPRGGGVGFEIFDERSALMTDFTQKVHYVRALQGELGRTIGQLPGVESARVHLTVPERSVFKRDKVEPSASVYVKLRPGHTLGPKQIAGISHLVSSSVENLSTERIAILDGDGRLLGHAPGTQGTELLTVPQELETRLEKRIMELLEPVVGNGRVVARVSVDLDLSRSEETSEQYDPENVAVRTKKEVNDRASNQRADNGGIAGAPGSLPQNGAAGAPRSPASGTQSSNERSSSETDWAIPKVVRHTQRPVGELRRLSVAVLVDAAALKGAEAEPAPGDEKTLVLPDDVEKAKAVGTVTALPGKEAVAELVKKAVGFNAERGDQIEVSYIPFSGAPPVEALAEPEVAVAAMPVWLPVTLAVLLGFGAVGGALYSTDRKRKAELAAAEARMRAAEEERAKTTKAEERKALDAEQAKTVREEAAKLIASNPGATIDVVKQWLADAPTRGG
jgi:flagellar M-ring protein FliF